MQATYSQTDTFWACPACVAQVNMEDSRCQSCGAAMQLAGYGPDFLTTTEMNDPVGIRSVDRVRQYLAAQYGSPALLQNKWNSLLHLEGAARSLDFYAELADYVLQRPLAGLILDIGCATGRLEVELAPHTKGIVVGLDVNAALLTAARAEIKAPNVRLVRADAAHLPIVSGAVDTALLVNVLDRVADPTEVLAECRRVTRRGGALILALTHDWGYSPNPISPDGVSRLLYDNGFRASDLGSRELAWVLPDAVNDWHLHLYRVSIARYERTGPE